MNNTTRYIRFTMTVCLILALAYSVSAAAPAPEYTTTYTITVMDDGTALWQVEYRTPLESDADVAGFEEYTRDLPGIYLPQVQDLMQRSAAQAAVGASRPMRVSNVSGDAIVQLSPTGKYGVVIYSFSWEGFAEETGTGLAIGDAFAGGLYLAKDSTLIIRYPDSFAVLSVDPSADQQRDNLIWYGQRSFAAGEPRVVLEKADAIPVIPITAGTIALILIIAVFVVFRRWRAGFTDDDAKEPLPALSAEEEKSVEDRIVRFLAANGAEQFQSDIVRLLGLPRSTVSASLNSLHQKGIIIKVRKGRENLIRLVKTEN
jgi:DNA-binding transcriptional ArsR family regulator